jgi:hypothetical protein
MMDSVVFYAPDEYLRDVEMSPLDFTAVCFVRDLQNAMTGTAYFLSLATEVWLM